MQNNVFILAAVFVPFVGAVLSLGVPNNAVQRWIGVIASFIAWLASIFVLIANVQSGPQLYRMGGWQPPYGIVLVADMLSAMFVLMASTVMFAGLVYALYCRDKCVRIHAFTAMFLCMETGLLGAFYTGDIFTMFVFMELLVLSSVSLVAISDNPLGLEAAIKYLFISSMGTLFLLLGISSLYVSFGSLNMADIARQLSTEQRPLLASIAAVMLMCAFLLKSAVFPFHFWQPDFHTTAPTPVHAVLSSVVVKIGVYGLIRLSTLLFVEEAATYMQGWFLVLGLISIYVGSLGALSTYDGKRMLAYSTFGQIGFILLGLGWGTPLALTAAIVYAFNHAFIKAALLMLFGVVSSRTKAKTARLTEVVGVGKSLPAFVGVLYLLGGMALAGLPPMNGFISKLALVRSGIALESWIPLGLAVGGGILTLMYMMRTWQTVFQSEPNADTTPLKDYNDSPFAPALLIAAALFLGLNATPLFELAQLTVEQINQPNLYIEAVQLADSPQSVSYDLNP
ncbi:MAG: complex I subunit 5 family protein [Phototrophicaceae bacterium]|jgi:multicomponent Na+:H+ antiporter subunit D